MESTGTTIAAVATPAAPGGIAALRISGERAIAVAGAVFRPAHRQLDQMAGYTAAFGRFVDAEGTPFDEGVCLIYRAPHSYTGEDVAELFCHGGVFVAQKVLDLLLRNGAEAAGPGEFTRRAFQNGKMDLTQAEAVMQLISASGDAALKEAYSAQNGALFRRIRSLEQRCIELSAAITAYIDYPDEDVEPPDGLADGLTACLDEIRSLLDGYENGRIYRVGVNTVIAGRPNTGKSALMNLLAGEERSIVTPLAGTTRDVVCETVRLGPLLLNVADTAGIRESDDPVEKIGIDRARERLRSAELILAVFDGSEPLTDSDRTMLELTRGLPCICVLNKSDLPRHADRALLEAAFDTVVELCALDGAGLRELETAVTEKLHARPSAEAVIFNPRQKQTLLRAREQLSAALTELQSGTPLDAVSVRLDQAAVCFGELTGRDVAQSVLDEVFSKFCVGK